MATSPSAWHLPPAALLLLVAVVGAAAGFAAGLRWVIGWEGETGADLSGGGALWQATVSGLVASSPLLAPLFALLLAALVAPRFREAAVARRTRALAEQVEQRTRQLARANAELDRIAHLDPLTQVANRRAFDRELGRLRESSARTALILIDIDRFKPINDRFGHAVGDLVLRRVAEALCACVAARGVVSRIGGDEFAVLARLDADETPADLAQKLLDEHVKHRPELPGAEISLSLGWALAEPGEPKLPLFLSADEALYRAKRGGVSTCNGELRWRYARPDSPSRPQDAPDDLEDTTDIGCAEAPAPVLAAVRAG